MQARQGSNNSNNNNNNKNNNNNMGLASLISRDLFPVVR